MLTEALFIDNIVVVDDGSPDRTFERAKETGDPRLVLLKHNINGGVGAAIISGHRKAIELGADLSVVMAGDGQMDPNYLTLLLTAVTKEGYDYAKGNRLKLECMKNMPKIRVLGNIILSFLTKLVSGYWNITDPQNGYTAIKTSVLKKLNLDHVAKGFQFENDMLIHLNMINAKVKDVPMPSRYCGKVSKIRLHKFVVNTFLFFINRFFHKIFNKIQKI